MAALTALVHPPRCCAVAIAAGALSRLAPVLLAAAAAVRAQRVRGCGHLAPRSPTAGGCARSQPAARSLHRDRGRRQLGVHGASCSPPAPSGGRWPPRGAAPAPLAGRRDRRRRARRQERLELTELAACSWSRGRARRCRHTMKAHRAAAARPLHAVSRARTCAAAATAALDVGLSATGHAHRRACSADARAQTPAAPAAVYAEPEPIRARSTPPRRSRPRPWASADAGGARRAPARDRLPAPSSGRAVGRDRPQRTSVLYANAG